MMKPEAAYIGAYLYIGTGAQDAERPVQWPGEVGHARVR